MNFTILYVVCGRKIRLDITGCSFQAKFQEFATKPDGVALLPISNSCEDEEYVDESALSPATVYVTGLNALIGTFSSTHVQLFVFMSEVTAVLNLSISTY